VHNSHCRQHTGCAADVGCYQCMLVYRDSNTAVDALREVRENYCVGLHRLQLSCLHTASSITGMYLCISGNNITEYSCLLLMLIPPRGCRMHHRLAKYIVSVTTNSNSSSSSSSNSSSSSSSANHWQLAQGRYSITHCCACCCDS
jgi:hypothetical protein